MNFEIILPVLACLVSYCTVAVLIVLLLGFIQDFRISLKKPSALDSSKMLKELVEVLKQDRNVTSEINAGIPSSIGWEYPGTLETIAMELRNLGCQLELIKVADRDLEKTALSPEQFRNRIERFSTELTNEIREER